MKNLPLLIGTILGTVLLVIGLSFFFANQSPTSVDGQTVDQALLVKGANKILLVGSDPAMTAEEAEATDSAMVEDQVAAEEAMEDAAAGVEDTVDEEEVAVEQELLLDRPVTIVEFSDFQCPACRAAQPIVDSVIDLYGEQITFIYRHFPLDNIHPNARLAAQASEVAVSQGKFWNYHDLLFETQTEWADISDKTELISYFAGLAEQLEIDREDFMTLIESSDAVGKAQEETSLGSQVGIQATPTFFVNGQGVSAPQLKTAVEQILGEQ